MLQYFDGIVVCQRLRVVGLPRVDRFPDKLRSNPRRCRGGGTIARRAIRIITADAAIIVFTTLTVSESAGRLQSRLQISAIPDHSGPLCFDFEHVLARCIRLTFLVSPRRALWMPVCNVNVASAVQLTAKPKSPAPAAFPRRRQQGRTRAVTGNTLVRLRPTLLERWAVKGLRPQMPLFGKRPAIARATGRRKEVGRVWTRPRMFHTASIVHIFGFNANADATPGANPVVEDRPRHLSSVRLREITT